MAANRSAIVAAAQSRINVPFRHQGRSAGGLDCVGLVIEVAHELGLSSFDTTDYPRGPDPDEMRRLLYEHLDPVAFRDVQPGDVLWLKTPEPQHLAIVTQLDPMQMIHAVSRKGVERVAENVVDRFWRRQLDSCFKFRGIE